MPDAYEPASTGTGAGGSGAAAPVIREATGETVGGGAAMPVVREATGETVSGGGAAAPVIREATGETVGGGGGAAMPVIREATSETVVGGAAMPVILETTSEKVVGGGAAMPVIRVAAVVLLRERHVLMVTARGRDVLYLPGGKIDPGETAAEALVRECREEIAVELEEPSIRSLFTVTVQAHGEPDGRLVAMTLFAAETRDEPTASSEVDSVHWVTSADANRCPPAGVETLARLRALNLID